MHLLHHNSRHPNLAMEESWNGMAEKFTRNILAMEVSEQVLKRLKVTQGDLDGRGWAPATWIDLVILLAVDDEALAAAAAPKAFEFHRLVTTRASSHLALVADNIMRTSWLAAEILSRDPDKAQRAALELIRNLATTAPALRTPFETFLFETTSLWTNLVDFAHARPSVRVRQGRGHFAEIFRFLASRFLTAPHPQRDPQAPKVPRGPRRRLSSVRVPQSSLRG